MTRKVIVDQRGDECSVDVEKYLIDTFGVCLLVGHQQRQVMWVTIQQTTQRRQEPTIAQCSLSEVHHILDARGRRSDAHLSESNRLALVVIEVDLRQRTPNQPIVLLVGRPVLQVERTSIVQKFLVIVVSILRRLL